MVWRGRPLVSTVCQTRAVPVVGADVKQLAIFHHDPEHEDSFMAKVEQEARETWSGAIVARERMQLRLV